MADRKIAAMHKEYGKSYGNKCAGCPSLICREFRSGRRVYKCKAYGDSCADSTDWAKSWPSCGLYGKSLPDGHVPLIERLKHSRRFENQPIEGQISMFGGNENGSECP